MAIPNDGAEVNAPMATLLKFAALAARPMAIAYVDEADALNPIATALSAAVDEFPIAVPKEPVTEDDEPIAVAFVNVEVEADAPNLSDAAPLPGLLMPENTLAAPA